jgi:hypothetical protein
VPFDIDRDGQLELIEVPALDLGSAFDLDASQGSYNPETHDFILQLHVLLDERTLGRRLIEVVGGPLRFEIIERGKFDVSSGRCRLTAEPFGVKDGPLSGLTFSNPPGTRDCFYTLGFGVVVRNNNAWPAGAPAGNAPSNIWIWPNTEVMLVWDSNALQVDIKPAIGVKGSSGQQVLPDYSEKLSPVDRTVVYVCSTVGEECKPAMKVVQIDVVSGGQEIPQSAPYNDSAGFHNTFLPPHTYDPNILIDSVRIDTGNPDSVLHLRWRLDYIGGTGQVGTVIPSVGTWYRTSGEHPMPGEYRFTPVVDGGAYPAGDRNKIVYFTLKVREPQ